MRSHKLFFFIAFCLFSSLNSYKLVAQQQISAAEVETKSLQLYQDKNWGDLIDFVKEALDEKNDYFYLRMRIGIAYYELKNYTKAEPQFKKALFFNSTDKVAQEYLYYSYLFNRKIDDAKAFSTNFSKELSEKIGTNKKSSINMIFFEGGTKISDSANYYNKIKRDRSNYFNPAVYIQAGLSHSIGKKNSLLHAITYFNQQSNSGTITQLQYYLSASFPLKNNWHFSPSIHWINISSNSQFITVQPNPPFPPIIKKQTTNTVNNYFVGSFDLQKRIANVTLSVGTTISTINNTTQIINSGMISLAPLGNSHVVFGCNAYLHTINNYKTINNSFSPFVYLEPLNGLSIKASYLANNNNNIIEMNGYLVNNSTDLTTSRWSVLVNGMINKHLSIYGLYQYEQKLETVQFSNYKYTVLVAGFKMVF